MKKNTVSKLSIEEEKGAKYYKNIRKILIKILRDTSIEQSLKKDFKSFSEICGPNLDMEDFHQYCEENQRNGYLKYDYENYIEDDGAYHMVRAFLPFPNYGYIIEKLSKSDYSEEGIKAELKRMESDGLIIINNQIVEEYILIENGDFSHRLGTNWKVNTESVILTTKGVSKWKYFIHNANENLIATITSIVAIIISIIALLK